MFFELYVKYFLTFSSYLQSVPIYIKAEYFYFSGIIFVKNDFFYSPYKYPSKANPKRGNQIPILAGLNAMSPIILPVASSISDIYYY